MGLWLVQRRRGWCCRSLPVPQACPSFPATFLGAGCFWGWPLCCLAALPLRHCLQLLPSPALPSLSPPSLSSPAPPPPLPPLPQVYDYNRVIKDAFMGEGSITLRQVGGCDPTLLRYLFVCWAPALSSLPQLYLDAPRSCRESCPLQTSYSAQPCLPALPCLALPALPCPLRPALPCPAPPESSHCPRSPLADMRLA